MIFGSLKTIRPVAVGMNRVVPEGGGGGGEGGGSGEIPPATESDANKATRLGLENEELKARLCGIEKKMSEKVGKKEEIVRVAEGSVEESSVVRGLRRDMEELMRRGEEERRGWEAARKKIIMQSKVERRKVPFRLPCR
jgi:hypothetical protein